MNVGIICSIVSLIYVLLIITAFFSKKRVKTFETRIYAILLITTVIGIAIELICTYFCLNTTLDEYVLLKKILLKAIVIYFGVFSLEFFLYVRNIGIDYSTEELKKINNAQRFKTDMRIIFVFVVAFIFALFLPIYTNVQNGIIVNSYGPICYFMYAISGIIILLCVGSMIINIRKKYDKRFIPLFSFLIVGSIVMYIQFTNPTLLLMSSMEAFVVVLMYFTLENPDVRLVEYEKKERELAQSANEAKSAFLSSMSHELRTPLNAIVGLSEDMLSYKEQVPNEVKEDCDDIINASNTLLEIIGNILDISKIEGGKLEIIESDYLPKEEIESLLKIMRTKVEEKDLKFNVFIDPNIPECLLGDRLRIKQIINNFLSNAIKYTEKGSIDFGARWVNNSLELKVRDTGRGIKKEDMGKLFENFERLHVEKTSAVQGTGLGLAITKNLVDLMGGTIKVTSEFGVGSTFDVIIPQKIGNKDNIVREALTVEEKHELDYSGKKVLIVDDNKLNIKVLRKAVQSFNFEIDECYNGEEALKMIDANKYDLIFMDIMMPVMGGEEAMGILKQKADFNTPVLALTADATTGAKERYLSMGFVDYLAKPFSRDTISTKLENVFKDMK